MGLVTVLLSKIISPFVPPKFAQISALRGCYWHHCQSGNHLPCSLQVLRSACSWKPKLQVQEADCLRLTRQKCEQPARSHGSVRPRSLWRPGCTTFRPISRSAIIRFCEHHSLRWQILTMHLVVISFVLPLVKLYWTKVILFLIQLLIHLQSKVISNIENN